MRLVHGTAAHACSFWPQVIINYRRKSVEGLSFDFTGAVALHAV
jgi:hypothetical protein